MKKQWLPGLVAILLIFLFAGCFQPLSPKLHTVQGVVVSPTGQRVPFADVIIDGQAAAQTDAEGGFSVSLKQGEHTLLVKEPGAQSQSKYFELSKNLNLQITLNQINLTSGWRYRKTSEGYTASLVLLLSEQTKALSVQIGGVYDRGQVALLNDQTFLWVESDGLSTQIDWVPLSQDDSEGPAVFVAFEIGLPALKRIKENARLTYSDKGTKTNGDYREMISQKLAGRAILPASELTYVGDMVADDPSTYDPNGAITINDLLRLLMNYNEAGNIQTGDLANAASWTNFKRNPFNRTGLVRDGLVSIPDLMILLMAYNLNTAMINTPIAPYNLAISSITGGYELTWEATAADVNDGYKVYGSATQTSGERLAGTLIDTIDGSENRVYEGPIAYPFVYVTAKNGATYESDPSEVIAVPQPYEAPQIALQSPVNGAANQLLKPTLTWVATPGVEILSSQRGGDITEFRVYVAETEVGLDSATPVIQTVNQSGVVNGSYTFPADLEPESTWYWKVVVVQGPGNETESAVRSFSIGKELMLILSETPILASQKRSAPVLWVVGELCPTSSERSSLSGRNSSDYYFLNFLYGKVLSVDPLLSHVLFYLQKHGETGMSPYPSGGTAYELTGGVYDFRFPDPDVQHFSESGSGERATTLFPAAGLWYMWVQALGDASKKDYQPFEVKFIEGLTLEVDLEKAGGNITIEEASKVCAETAGATAVYHVDLDFSEVSEFIDSWKLETQIATKVGITPPTTTYYGTLTEWATDITVYFSTECTKYATMTLTATVISFEATTTGIATKLVADVELMQLTHNFILDLAAPTAAIAITENSTETKMATITFFATDTKCLELEEIEFMVWIDKGPLGAWEKVFFSWPDVEVGEFATDTRTIGSGVHAATFTGQYNSAIDAGVDASMTAWATFTLDMNPFGMDHATLTVAATVNDCCDLGISGHPVYTTDATLVDNVFLSSNFGKAGYPISDDVLLTWEGFKELDGKYYINNQTNLATPATLTVRMVDFTIVASTTEFPTNLWYNYASVSSTFTQATYTCTGFATKTVWKTTVLSTDTGFYPANLELSFWSTFTATDDHGNVHTGSKEIFVDTKPATLVFVAGYSIPLDPSGNSDYVLFSFDEDINKDYPGFSATLTIATNPAMVYTQSEIEQHESGTKTFKLKTKGFALPPGSAVLVETKFEDKKGNIGVSGFIGLTSTH